MSGTGVLFAGKVWEGWPSLTTWNMSLQGRLSLMHVFVCARFGRRESVLEKSAIREGGGAYSKTRE